MANVDKIAELRGTSSIDAIEFWKQVCTVAGTSLSTDKVLEALRAQGAKAATITAGQLAEAQKCIESEKRNKRIEPKRTKTMKMGYQKNIELALSLGFEEVIDENAYNGKYYIKEDKIWIHNIEALKAKLQIQSDEELRDYNYDVDSYYKYIDYSNEMVDHEIETIIASINGNDSVLSGRYDLLHEKETLKAMAILSEEGFDDEILADLAHQMSKR